MDLDLFGSGSLFEYLSSARTGGGRRWLADALLSPASLSEVIARQEAITEIRTRNDLREYLADAAGTGESNFQGDALKEWLDEAPVKFETRSYILAVCLCVLNLAAVGLGLAGRVVPEVPLATLAVVGLFTVVMHAKTSKVRQGASSQVPYEINLLIRYARRFRREPFSCARLKVLKNEVSAVPERELRRMLRNLKLLKWHEDPAFTYLSYLSLWGTIFRHYARKATDSGKNANRKDEGRY